MTPERLKQIRERCEKATEGPWEFKNTTPRTIDSPNDSLIGDEQYYPWAPSRDEDYEFIAHARTDIPDLLAERDVLVEGLRQSIKLCTRCGGNGTCPVLGTGRKVEACYACAPARAALRKVGEE